MDQVDYYNHFGQKYKKSILACPEPELWTTDYDENGRVYGEMKQRLKQQEELIDEYFATAIPVLDIGCGFGRQAILLAKKGYKVTGVDASHVFIDIAKDLFDKHGYDGSFIHTDIIKENMIKEEYAQILLLDVLEHIKPGKRLFLFKKIYQLAQTGGIMIVSVPHIKKRWRSWLNNRVRKGITQYFSFFHNKEEHPYPVPGFTQMKKSSKNWFQLKRFIESLATDYYVFQRS